MADKMKLKILDAPSDYSIKAYVQYMVLGIVVVENARKR